MIKVQLKSEGLKTHRYIIKVSYGDTVGINQIVDTKLNDIQVASLIASYMKSSYTLEIQEIPCSSKCNKLPLEYYETFSIDTTLSLVSRLRFIDVNIVKEPRIVYIDKIIKTEL